MIAYRPCWIYEEAKLSNPKDLATWGTFGTRKQQPVSPNLEGSDVLIYVLN